MAGRTSLMADKALNLYNGQTPTPPTETWVGLFTTAPTVDHPTAHLGVEWGAGRGRVYPNGDPGSPNWTLPTDFDSARRFIQNSGSIVFSSITLTTSPSTVVAFGVWDASAGGNLLTWDLLTSSVTVLDGEDRAFGTGDLKIRGD